MELLLMQLTDMVLPSAQLALQAGEESRTPIGYIVLAVIIGPVLLLTVAAIIQLLPQKTKIPELFLGAFVLLISFMVAAFAAISYVLRFVVPQ